MNRNRKQMLKVAAGVLTLGLVAFASTARAENNLGRIDGSVVDGNGMPLGRVTVTATSPTQIGGARVVQSNESGEYHLLGLTPGNFAVHFSAQGLKEVVKNEVHVGVADPVALDVLMEAVTAEETQVITAQHPVVETRRTTIGHDFDAEFLKNLPVADRRYGYQSIMSMAPGVNSTYVGGATTPVFGGGNPSVRGGMYTSNSYMVDGFDTTDMVGHTFGTLFNYDAISEIQVVTAGQGAENSLTPGGAVNIVTKSGSNQFQVDSSVYYQNPNLVWKGQGEGNSEFSTAEANLNLGGPIVRDKLWYYSAFEYYRFATSIPPDPNGILPTHPAKVQNGFNYLAKLTYAANARNNFTLWTQGGPASIDNLLQLPFVYPEAELRLEQNAQIYAAQWESRPRDDFFFKLSGGYQHLSLDLTPQQCQWDPNCSKNLSTYDLNRGVAIGNSVAPFAQLPTFDHEGRNTLNVAAEASFFPNGSLLGTHELKTGGKYRQANNPVTWDYAGGQAIYAAGTSPLQRSLYCTDYNPMRGTVDYDPANPMNSHCLTGPLSLESTAQMGTYYLQDTWSPTRYVHIVPGAAVDYVNMNDNTGRNTYNFVTATPHFNTVWDATHDGKTAIRAGFNQYVDPGYLYIGQFAGRNYLTENCPFNSMTGQYDMGCSGGGFHTVGQPLGVDAMHNPIGAQTSLTPPRTNEALFGIDRELFDQYSLGGEFVYRRFDNMYEDVETNQVWMPGGAAPAQYKNGNAEAINDLETPASANRRYYAFTTLLKKNVGHARMLGSWTVSKLEGTFADAGADGGSYFYNFNSPYLNNPTTKQFYSGPLPDDRRHVVKFQLSYDVTQSFLFGAQYMFMTGAPYSRYNADPNGGPASLALPRGIIASDLTDSTTWQEARLPDLAQLDLHAAFSFKQMTGQNLMAMVDVFNIFNSRTPTAVEENAGPTFGQVTNRQLPMSVRFGLRYMY